MGVTWVIFMGGQILFYIDISYTGIQILIKTLNILNQWKLESII